MMISQKDAGFQSLLPLLIPYKRQLVAGGLCMVIYVGCWPILAKLAGLLIPAIGSGQLLVVIKVISQALLVFLVQKLAQFGQDILLAGPALRVSQKLRKNLFEKLQKVELRALDSLSSGDLTYRLTEDADRVGEVLYKTIQDTTPSALQLFAVFFYMIWLDWQLSFATLLLAPIVALLVSQFGAKVIKAAERSQRQVSGLASLLGEAIQGLPLVRAYAAEGWLQNRFDREVDLHRQARYQTLRLLALQHPVVGFIEALGILTVLVIGAIRIESGALDAQGFSSYFAALLMLIDPISHLTTNYNELQQGQASLRRLRDIEREPIENPDSKEARSLIKTRGDISLKKLSFSYDSSTKVLQDISLNIKAGQIVALVGPSGAGKTTLFSLLLRFMPPESGSIFLDGDDISTIKVKELRRKIALVPQQTIMFSGSIYDAISFGRKASENKIKEAAKIANAHEFIMKLPQKYNTNLKERAANISGGQMQRIAIARAVLGNPSLLLLDEATSALDAEAETSVQLGLRQAMKDRTVLVIAHRLATVQEADQIVVLDQGRICEIGTHDHLMRLKGRYRELCERQLIRGPQGE